ncbi:hypothetical protein CXG81DRAFT_26719 [Caulochytrium protostelioides]|uniref:EamA domain-containing protein n=1 Tax=Caulochytrium protostelioides TaxID=1555241 RepID=A0A4P9X6D1_9FUNG|nr:hypothetical protein CXG81DRAFT_26719 [Caulochytrium protostelioides]|eukprot:RKP00580.1 hypothetical protein CXG81DRAFT_26719 [Caulochytrium protostelioides]
MASALALWLAALSGVCASMATVLTKLALRPEPLLHLPVPWLAAAASPATARLVAGAGVVLANLTMWVLFTAALARAPNTLIVTVVNSGTNLAISGLCGALIWHEPVHGRYPWGVGCVLLGTSLILLAEARHHAAAAPPKTSTSKKRA